MVRLQANKVPIDVETLAEAARREPVTVMNGDREAFVVVAPEWFRKMDRAVRGTEADPLIQAARGTQRRAAAAGLSEQDLDELLADES